MLLLCPSTSKCFYKHCFAQLSPLGFFLWASLSLLPAHYHPVNEKSRVFPVGPWEEAHDGV